MNLFRLTDWRPLFRPVGLHTFGIHPGRPPRTGVHPLPLLKPGYPLSSKGFVFPSEETPSTS